VKGVSVTLENVAEILLCLQDYTAALCFSSVTLHVAEKVPPGDKVSQEVIATNQGHLQEARRHVKPYTTT